MQSAEIPNTMPYYEYLPVPSADDFEALARYVGEAPPERLNPMLLQVRAGVIARLFDMAKEPGVEQHRRAYHTLRLFVR